ncbi:MAG TPA: hypothetical protein VN635_02635 [Conexibacter sp.]|nr:hypothetical protein [Conexibacter sp.]
MSESQQVALYAGVVLALLALVGRLWRYRGLGFPAAAFLELLGLGIAPFPIPVLAGIVGQSTQRDPLPVFNTPEQRVALFLGAVVLIGAVVTGILAVMMRAFRPVPAR